VGGHLNISITGADEIKGLIESGDIVPLVSMSENRMSAFPDIQCTGELGIDSYVGTWRCIIAKKGTPDAAVNALSAAIEEAWNMPAYQDFLRQASYLDRPGYANAAELTALQNEEYVTFEEYLRVSGLI
jgi:tripartite-type tricarboxylate transporter receptor subunit TctC